MIVQMKRLHFFNLALSLFIIGLLSNPLNAADKENRTVLNIGMNMIRMENRYTPKIPMALKNGMNVISMVM